MTTDDKSDQKPEDGRQSEIDQLKADLKAVREELAKLARDSGKFASAEAQRQTDKAAGMADDASKTINEYKDILEQNVREHPMAAVGVALVAGLLFSSIQRRD